MTAGPDGMDKHYSETSFWDKVGKYAKLAGREAIEKALILYYAMNDPEVPTWAKSVCAGALGYFILPLDALPDPIFVDDIGVMVAALGVIAVHVTPATTALAQAKVAEWLD